MLLRLSTIAFVLFLGASDCAQDSRVWNFDDNTERPALEFGKLDSDETLIAFSCDPAARRMTIMEAVASTKLTPGPSAQLKLSAGSVSLDVTGDAIASETGGTVNIEVSGPPNPRVFTLLKAGPTLTIEVPGAKEKMPLAGAAPHVAAFERMCWGRQ